MAQERESFTCPVCGAEVPAGSKACPECGSDERTGWSDNTRADGLDLPAGPDEEGDFDYDDFVKREFPHGPERRSRPPPALSQLAWSALVFLLIGILVWWLL